jgi:hypothetical protein
VIDQGFQVAVDFFTFGLFWLFVAQLALLGVMWMRRLLG